MKTILPRVLALAGLVAVAGCGNGNKAPNDMATGKSDMAQKAGPPDLGCYANPTTSIQLLNSCPPAGVTVDQIDKKPTLPLLNPDGTRPPLP